MHGAKAAHDHTDGGHRASDILVHFVTTFPGEEISMADFVAALGHRAFGLLLLLVSLPTALPIPGISSVLGLPLILFGAQMLLGFPRPHIPARLARVRIERRKLVEAMGRAVPYLRRAERMLRPRATGLTGTTAERAVGAMTLLLGLILILPIWGGNLLPAIAIAAMALGMVERDGMFVLGGLGLGVVSTLLVGTVVAFGAAALSYGADLVFRLAGLFG